MAIYDAMFEFSDAQTVAFAAGTALSTNVLDLQKNDMAIFGGNPVWLNVQVETACAEVAGATTGDRTLKVEVLSDEVAALNSALKVVLSSGVLTETNLTAGAFVLRVPLPVETDKDLVRDGGNDGRYIGLRYTTTGTHATATGTVNAWLDDGSQSDFANQVAVSNI